jgi:hypothetical protein
VLFDVKINDWWLERKNVEEISVELNLPVVPVIGQGNLYDMVELTNKGFNSRWGNFIAEGVIARPKIGLKTRSGHRIITKIKHSDFS